MVDLDPKTSQSLQLWSQLLGPGSSIFYVPSEQAVVTTITKEKMLNLKRWCVHSNTKIEKQEFLAKDFEFV